MKPPPSTQTEIEKIQWRESCLTWVFTGWLCSRRRIFYPTESSFTKRCHSETKRWRAGAATMPALNSRLVWRHPGQFPSSPKPTKFARFWKTTRENGFRLVGIGWAVLRTYLVCGLVCWAPTPHTPMRKGRREEAAQLTGIKIHRSNPTSLVAPVSSTSNMQVSTDIHKTKKHNLFPKKRKKEKSEEWKLEKNAIFGRKNWQAKLFWFF